MGVRFFFLTFTPFFKKKNNGRWDGCQTAADIVHAAIKKLIELCVEGAKVLDLCVEGDKLVEAGTGAVYNKAVKGVKVSKGWQSLSIALEKVFFKLI